MRGRERDGSRWKQDLNHADRGSDTLSRLRIRSSTEAAAAATASATLCCTRVDTQAAVAGRGWRKRERERTGAADSLQLGTTSLEHSASLPSFLCLSPSVPVFLSVSRLTINEAIVPEVVFLVPRIHIPQLRSLSASLSPSLPTHSLRLHCDPPTDYGMRGQVREGEAGHFRVSLSLFLSRGSEDQVRVVGETMR